jgi:hypothetical protein
MMISKSREVVRQGVLPSEHIFAIDIPENEEYYNSDDKPENL